MVADYVELLIGETRSVQDAGGQRNSARSLRPRPGRALPRPAGFSGSRASGTLGDHRSAIHFLLSAFSRGWQKAARQSRCMPWIRKGNGCLQGHPVLTCCVASRSSRLFCESPVPHASRFESFPFLLGVQALETAEARGECQASHAVVNAQPTSGRIMSNRFAWWIGLDISSMGLQS